MVTSLVLFFDTLLEQDIGWIQVYLLFIGMGILTNTKSILIWCGLE